jgi:hypothetical protein
MFSVQKSIVARLLARLSLVTLVLSTILNAYSAFSLSSLGPAIQFLAFIAFAINILAICNLSAVVLLYVPKLKSGSNAWSNALFWRSLAMSIATASVAALLSFVSLVWATSRAIILPEKVMGRRVKASLFAWFAVWGVCALLQIGAYTLIVMWTKHALHSRSHGAVDLDMGVGSPEMGQSPLQPRPTAESFRSQDPTLTSPPQTPTTIGMASTLRLSQSGSKAGPATSRTRLVHSTSFTKDSAKSSFEYTSSEAVSIDHPFDHWDGSGLGHEVCSTMQSTSPVARSGLATIPGSRPESPATALDGPFLPDMPHAASSYALPNSPKASLSSPPSSPTNFSRPTSRQTSHPYQPILETPPEDLIHPLFRPSSPHPAPVAMAGTMVTASPLAGQSITQKSLTRMRSASMPVQTSPLKESAPALPEPWSNAEYSGPGSPGPSIIEDEEGGSDIPGFILSAGQRSSLVGYGRRKSVKSRPASFHSQGDRLSMVLI